MVVGLVAACKKGAPNEASDPKGTIIKVDLPDGSHGELTKFRLDLHGIGDGQFAAYQIDATAYVLSIGLVDPINLLRYRYSDGLPPECRADAVHDFLVEKINRSKCHAKKVSLGSVPTVVAQCGPWADNENMNACPVEYVAQIWAETLPGSTADYDLLLYARLRRVCARETAIEGQMIPPTEIVWGEQKTDFLREALRVCHTSETR